MLGVIVEYQMAEEAIGTKMKNNVSKHNNPYPGRYMLLIVRSFIKQAMAYRPIYSTAAGRAMLLFVLYWFIMPNYFRSLLCKSIQCKQAFWI